MARRKKNKSLPDTFGTFLDKKQKKNKAEDKEAKKNSLLGALSGCSDTNSASESGSSRSGGLSALPKKENAATSSTSGNASVSKPSISTTERKDVFSCEDSQTAYEDERTWQEILADLEHWNYLPFSHGMEMELVICDDNGEYVEGDDVVYILKELVLDGKRVLSQLINGERSDFPPMPEYIRSKIASMPYIRDDKEKGKNLGFDYKIDNQYLQDEIRVDAFGRDGNVTMATIILELVTPPCQYAQELAYWAGTLFQLAKVCLPRGHNIMSVAINPTMKEYVNGLSHGDHHHVGSFADEKEKVYCYNLIRNFLPHIVALTVNSPFIDMKPTDEIKTKEVKGKPRYVAPNCVRSIRLKNNTTMLSNSNEPNKYIPYLQADDVEQDKKHFLAVTQYASLYDARFQDVFPFTKYGTIEMRITDAQLSICRRIGIALLLEAIYYKARKMYNEGKKIPAVNSKTLCFCRRNSIERGLIGLFKPKNISREELNQYDSSGYFSKCYLGPEKRPYRFMFQAVQGMFRFLKEELQELQYLYSPFMKPLLQSVFGDVTYAAPPITEAEYQLSLYDWKIKQGQHPNIFEDLKYFTLEYSKDPIQNPLTGNLTLPDYMQ